MIKIVILSAMLAVLAVPASATSLSPSECATREAYLRKLGNSVIDLRTSLKGADFRGWISAVDGPDKLQMLELIGAQNEANDALLKLGIAAGFAANGFKRCADR
jgi:hypothetical protein